jgi:hypothetical protein
MLLGGIHSLGKSTEKYARYLLACEDRIVIIAGSLVRSRCTQTV